MFKWVAPDHRRLILSIMLVSLLFLVYLLTLAGVNRSNDELWIIDATQSVATRGDFQLNETLYLRNRTIADVEPVQPVLAAPLYWLVWNTGWIGNIHGLSLFNPLITALTALLLFYYALDLDYSERTALIAALLFGISTMAWPYAQYLFREPLTALGLLATAFCWERWRRAFTGDGQRAWAWFGTAAVVTVLALLSKESALIVLPAFVLLAYPGAESLRRYRKQIIIAGIAIVVIALLVVAGLFAFRQTGALASRYRLDLQVRLLVSGMPQALDGLLGYFVSPGKAIWWFSPVTLLALASPALLPRTRWRESWLMLGTVLWFGLAYAAIKRDGWFGGAGWGSRFMLPILPFLMLAALPALNRLIASARLWPKIALGALALIGMIVQIGGVYVDIYSYYGFYQHATRQLPWVGPAIWDVRWSQAVGSLLYLPQAKTDILWLVSGADWLVIALIGLAIVITAVLVWWLHARTGQPRRMALLLGLASPILALAIGLVGLARAFDDPRYQADRPALWHLKDFLEQNLHQGDTIMLSTQQYIPFFRNYYKGRSIWYALPDSPGERYSPEQPPKVVSDKVEDLIAPLAVQLFTKVAQGGEYYHAKPIWLVVDTGPFLPWATRPPEWYFAKYAYTVDATEFDPRVRLVEYLPKAAPDAYAAPERPVDASFGSSIHLIGYDVWSSSGESERLRADDMLGISLVWEAAAPINVDYTVAAHWLDSSGQVVAQQDRQPVGGFAPTSHWKIGEHVRDNYGFIVPPLPPGRYTISLAVYSWPSLERLPVKDSAGLLTGDTLGLFTLEIK